ncbi:hypothetical protein [Bacillus sp. P14.5]|uniref:hypothetical protein n=1 Tax=Bacillus sp. P14.5 TaxID=1983400 RepID=UPI0013B05057|nr:hypothetical protein [Bacillus sp. P14.5]
MNHPKEKLMQSEGTTDSLESHKREIDAVRRDHRQHGTPQERNRCSQKGPQTAWNPIRENSM